MSRRAVSITLTERQLDILSRLDRANKTEQNLARRVRIVLLAAQGMQNKDISTQLSTTDLRVSRWRRRWAESEALLKKAEELVDNGDFRNSQLREVVSSILSDRPRSGAPPTFSAEQIAAIFAIACMPPEDLGLPISHWTAKALAHEVIKRKIISSISTRQVARFLKISRDQASPNPILAQQ